VPSDRAFDGALDQVLRIGSELVGARAEYRLEQLQHVWPSSLAQPIGARIRVMSYGNGWDPATQRFFVGRALVVLDRCLLRHPLKYSTVSASGCPNTAA